MIKIKLQKTVALGLVVIMFSSLVLISFPKKVYAADSAVLNQNAKVGISGAIAAGLFLGARINGSVKLTQDNINAITTIVMAEFEASGSKDKLIAQANALGDAIASGASNTAIKALASGSVIYAFAKALQQTWIHTQSSNVSVSGYNSYGISNSVISDTGISSYSYKQLWVSSTGQPILLLSNSVDVSSFVVTQYAYDSSYVGIAVTYPRGLTSSLFVATNAFFGGGSLDGSGSSYYSSSSSDYFSLYNSSPYFKSTSTALNDEPSLSLPASVPSGLSNTVGTWDGTSDFVYSPGTDTALSPTDTVDVSPTYVGPDVIDGNAGTGTDNPPSEEEGLKLPWIETILKAIDGLKDIDMGIDKGIADVLPGIDSISKAIDDGIAGVKEGIDSITTKTGEIVKAIDDALASVDDFLAVPDDVSFTADITNILTGKLQVIPQINTALGKLNVATRPLIIYYPFLDGTTKEINLNWYEPMREQVKTGLGLVFQVMTFLTCFAFISNVFGMGIRVGTKETYSDRPDERRN